jgi:23S rRNA (cytosine1962-C5)-methyltransferase
VKDVVLRGGPPVHPHVFSKRILRADRSVADGDLVRVKTREGRVVGWGFAHRSSIVALRMLTWDADVVPDEAWLRERVRAAARLRREVLDLPSVTNAWREVHAEGDGLSGLVVDRYASTAVASLFSLGWHRRFGEVERVLREVCACDDVVPRVDRRTATHEGFDWPQRRDGTSVEIQEHGVRYVVDPHGGHKTGFFLDQRENRRLLARLARGRSVFDGMTYTGGFAVAAAVAGAARVRAMDLDERAVALIGRNAERNGVHVEAGHGDVFDALRALAEGPESERPEVLVLDPPKWAKERTGLGAALRRYADLNRLGLQAVRTDGLVCTSSCSGLVSEAEFLHVLRGVAFDTRRAVRFLHVGGAGPDHPVAANFPESRYLKCVILQVGAPGTGPGHGERPGHARGAERGPRRPARPTRHEGRGPGRGPRPPRRDGDRDRRGRPREGPHSGPRRGPRDG